MNILLAPDKFKGTLTADEVCGIVSRGLHSVLPEANIVTCPIADGGDGFAEVLCERLGGEWVECPAHDAMGELITARYALCGETAVMEMSEASGIRLVPEERRDIWQANTVGTGEMMRHAIEHGGVRRIVLGIGGSVTNDAGCGMASALGAKFFDAEGNELDPTPRELVKCVRMDLAGMIQLPEIHAACDVDNPLLGENGATSIYGPQKGAGEEDIERLDDLLGVVAKLSGGDDLAALPGAGAAGGLGFGLMQFCGAELLPGFDLVAQETGLIRRIHDADIVITGEGKLDAQTLQGKGPAGVAGMARNAGKQVAAVAGIIEPAALHLFDYAYALHDGVRPLEETIQRGEELLEAAAVELAKELAAGEG